MEETRRRQSSLMEDKEAGEPAKAHGMKYCSRTFPSMTRQLS